jgi:hypothetical protein
MYLFVVTFVCGMFLVGFRDFGREKFGVGLGDFMYVDVSAGLRTFGGDIFCVDLGSLVCANAFVRCGAFGYQMLCIVLGTSVWVDVVTDFRTFRWFDCGHWVGIFTFGGGAMRLGAWEREVPC